MFGADHEAVLFRKRKWSKHHRVGEREQHNIRTNTEPQQQHRDHGELRRSPQSSYCGTEFQHHIHKHAVTTRVVFASTEQVSHKARTGGASVDEGLQVRFDRLEALALARRDGDHWSNHNTNRFRIM